MPARNGALFCYSGQIVDEREKPVPGVEVTVTRLSPDGRGLSYIGVTKSDAGGRFAIRRTKAISGERASAPRTGDIRVEFRGPNHAFHEVTNPAEKGGIAATDLNVRMRDGRLLTGIARNARGQAVRDALVEVRFAGDANARRAVMTDSGGRFLFLGLPDAEADIRILTTGRTQPFLTGRAIASSGTANLGDIILSPVSISNDTPVRELFGMTLVDVDARVQDALHLSAPDGVAVLDPGRNGLGRDPIGGKIDLRRGDQFWLIGETPVKNFAEMVDTLLALGKSTSQEDVERHRIFRPEPGGDTWVRVVYRLRRTGMTGTNTQYMRLRPEDIAELESVQATLRR